ncbi:MAG TPA: ABC transporter ATP-binding protein [Coleofasciculaceae cyanobacterium]
MAEVAISVQNVSKCFRQYGKPIDRLKEMLLPGKKHGQEFWALRDISFDIYRGETFGIIGRNGAGKSTLLQLICGTLQPTSGIVQVHGRVAALLELGAGFNPEFSGRDNVYMNGAILGLSRADVDKRFDEIAAFADIGSFIDQPVKTYSSGMYVRLAFASAIHVEPDILIVDEALAVGDIFFQQKCFRHLEKLRDQGTSIIFVSHDTQAVVKLCDRAIILQNGYLKHEGTPADMAAKYMELYYSQFYQEAPKEEEGQTVLAEQVEASPVTVVSQESTLQGLGLPTEFTCDFPSSDRYGCAVGLIQGIAISGTQGQPQSSFEVGEEIVLSIKINPHSIDLCPLNIGFQLKNRLGQVVVGTNTCMIGKTMDPELFGQSFICQFKFNLALFPDQYTVTLAASEYDLHVETIYDWVEGASVIETYLNEPLKQAGIYFPEIVVGTA